MTNHTDEHHRRLEESVPSRAATIMARTGRAMAGADGTGRRARCHGSSRAPPPATIEQGPAASMPVQGI